MADFGDSRLEKIARACVQLSDEQFEAYLVKAKTDESQALNSFLVALREYRQAYRELAGLLERDGGATQTPPEAG